MSELSHKAEVAQKLHLLRTKCAENFTTQGAHQGYLMEFLIVEIAGLTDAIEALK